MILRVMISFKPAAGKAGLAKIRILSEKGKVEGSKARLRRRLFLFRGAAGKPLNDGYEAVNLFLGLEQGLYQLMVTSTVHWLSCQCPHNIRGVVAMRGLVYVVP